MSLPFNLIFEVDADKWQRIVKSFIAHGVTLPIGSDGVLHVGKIDSHGVKCDYNWDGESLAITVKSKPWIVSEQYVRDNISEFISES